MIARRVLLLSGLIACADDDLSAEQQQSQVAARCAGLSVADCKQDHECDVLSGRLYDRERSCIRESVELACMARQPCGEAHSVGEAPDGRRWGFITTCQPAGFRDVTNAMPGGVIWVPCSAP